MHVDPRGPFRVMGGAAARAVRPVSVARLLLVLGLAAALLACSNGDEVSATDLDSTDISDASIDSSGAASIGSGDARTDEDRSSDGEAATDEAPSPIATPEPEAAAADADDAGAGDTATDADTDADTETAPDGSAARPASLDELQAAASERDGCPAMDGVGLNADGAAMFDRSVANNGLEYRVQAVFDPDSGALEGRLDATIPDPGTPNYAFRAFAGLPSFNAGLAVTDATVNGEPVQVSITDALVAFDGPAEGPAEVSFSFAYNVGELQPVNPLSALGGDTLVPAEVGLLGRTPSGAQLGHWFPVFLPPDATRDPNPQGFGDIGTFPAATICAEFTVPAEYQIVSGGFSIESAGDDNSRTWIEGAQGLRDLSLVVARDLVSTDQQVEGVNVRVWTRAGEDELAAQVLRETTVSQQALHDAFGPYPWVEIDVVAVPLGSGVGGMEWPGMIWMEEGIFAGSIPGLGDLGSFLGDDTGGLDLGSLLGESAALQIETVRVWTIAHELGHEWWHALVGNDSIASPAVDEPLAQLAACVAMVELYPENWQEICRSQTTDAYVSYRGLGVADAPADQATDDFDSSLQYGAVIYGKAPGFYFEAAEVIGWDPLIDSLAEFVADHPFELVSTDTLRSHLVQSAGSDGDEIGRLWDRWFSGTFGDEDLGTADAGALGGLGDLGNLDGLEGLEGVDPEVLNQMFEDLLGDSDLLSQLDGLDLDGLGLDPETQALMDQLLEGLSGG